MYVRKYRIQLQPVLPVFICGVMRKLSPFIIIPHIIHSYAGKLKTYKRGDDCLLSPQIFFFFFASLILLSFSFKRQP